MATLAPQELGQELLDEVHEEDFTSILQSIRRLARQKEQQSNILIEYFNITPLDAIVSVFLRHSKRLNAQVQGHGQGDPPVIEVSSTTAGGGKTHLCYYAIAKAVMPLSSGGKGAAAVVLDADGKFDVERLVGVMMRVHDAQSGRDTESTEANSKTPPCPEVVHALRHVHIFRPQSLVSLIATVDSLSGYLLDLSAHYSAARALSLLVIDSVAAFYWQERAEQEYAQEGDQNSDRSDDVEPKARYAKLVGALRRVQKEFDCAVLLTNWGIYPVKTPVTASLNPRPSVRPLLPSVWTTFCTCRLIIGREEVKKFPEGMTLSGAERDKETRMEIVQKGRFWCAVDRWELSESERKGFREEKVQREFGLSIVDSGVEIDDD